MDPESRTLTTSNPSPLTSSSVTAAVTVKPPVFDETSVICTPIRCYGEVDVDLGIRCIRRSFPWSFVIADVVHPILGTDFLAAKLSYTNHPDETIHHHIDTGDSPPVYFKARPLTGEKLKAAKEEFQFLLNAGIIRRSNSPWASRLHFTSFLRKCQALGDLAEIIEDLTM
ncbi:hypothetical protein Pmani_029750 [Petrolisthes manimaculis]|uniref:Uncharacterized protein n=1 Tax=Petrolisthes manimaculis TaxID=1843537 RepID=A0AAE1NYT8_9EUCA|nr:hypothetical protein Pmani_029750 [Petrolisthes manimaculis]